MENAKYLKHNRSKASVITLHNAGGVGKTTAEIALIEACFHRKVDPAIFSGDKNHTELVRIYGDKAHNFDVRTNASAFINALQSPNKVTAIDTPSAFVDVFNEIFGDVDSVLDAHEMMDDMPFYMIPVATNDKCIKSINRIASLFSGAKGDYRMIYVLNEGLMSTNGVKEELLQEFFTNKAVIANLESGKATTLRVETKFTSKFSDIMKTQRLREFVETKGDLMERVLAHKFLRETDDQFAQILGLPDLDNRTEMEKCFGVDITAKFTGKDPKRK
jgi:hypothetical protein